MVRVTTVQSVAWVHVTTSGFGAVFSVQLVLVSVMPFSANV
jgi:hypothetical protein